jgi:hypothetical protein
MTDHGSRVMYDVLLGTLVALASMGRPDGRWPMAAMAALPHRAVTTAVQRLVSERDCARRSPYSGYLRGLTDDCLPAKPHQTT